MYSRTELIAKRAVDIVASAVGLVALAPALGLVAGAVKCTSRGPVIFRQLRVGRGGNLFWLLKFRTMRTGSRGPAITAGGDSRITAVGRILRKTKVDELPELLNVFRGDMSLVGPRPEVPKYVACYSDDDRKLLQRVRPGITDPATISFRNEEELLAQSSDPEGTYVDEILPVKIGMYRQYLSNASFSGDLRVLIETLWVILRPSSARPPE